MRKPSGEDVATSVRPLGCSRLQAGAQRHARPAFAAFEHTRRAAQRRLVCIHWASCPDEQRSVGGLETMIVHAADSSAASQLHPSQSAYRKRAGSSSGHFRPQKSLETEYAGHVLNARSRTRS
eukprot:3280677-Prymnesium_polylepis.1